jgi:MFS transporter, ACS family, hexuronate transporter
MTPEPSRPVGRTRWVVCLLLFASVAINYIDRNALGLLKEPLSRSLGWSETDYAAIGTAFFWAYACGYLFGGRIIDRLGVKRGLPWFVGVWSIAAMAHGLVGLIDPAWRIGWPATPEQADGGGWSLPATVAGFMAARALLGVSEGGNFPGAIKAVAEWFPARERALATGLFNAGSNVGAVICPLLVAFLLTRYGWQVAFYVTGALGFLWLVAWKWVYDAPETHPGLSAEELAFITSDRPPAAPQPRETVTLLSLFRHRPVWAYLLASFFAGPIWGIYMLYFPDFMKKSFPTMSFLEISGWTSIFYLIGSFGGIAGGWLAGYLLGRGWSINRARKTTLAICAVCVVPIFLAPHMPTPWLAVLIVGIAGGAHQGWSANLFSVVSDTMPGPAISSTVGLGGFICFATAGLVPWPIAYVLEKTGSYSLIFAVASSLYLVSLLCIHLLVPVIGRQPD